MNARFMIAALVSCFASASPALAAWTIEPVDTGGTSGYSLFMDFDSTLQPHAGYYRSGGLDYAVRTDAGWQHQATVPYAEAFALDQNNTPFFANLTGATFDLEFSVRLPNGLLLGHLLETNPVSENVYVGFDSKNLPHVAYVDTTSRNLEYAHWNGTTWSTKTIANGARFQYGNSTFLATLDRQDRMHFAWGGYNDAMQYAKPNTAGTSWQVASIGSVASAIPNDLVVDDAGNVHVAYDLFTSSVFTGGLSYAVYNGASWSTQRIPGLDSFIGADAQLVIDEAGQIHFFTLDADFAGPSLLKHVYRAGNTWTNELITSWDGDISGPAAIEAEADARGLHVLYADDFKNISYAFFDQRVPGDFNGSGIAGIEDYDLWKSTFGSTNQLAADANGNGVVDAGDYTVWRDRFGGGSAAAASAFTAVPEPAVSLLAWIAFVSLGDVGARSRRFA